MTIYYDSKQKIRNVRRTIDALLDGSFPLESGRRALTRIRRTFDDIEKQLDRARKLNDRALERQQAHNVTVKVFETLPILGFISRSMSVKNAFEFVDPLQGIGERLLEGAPQIILSSEWDYIPFAIAQTPNDLTSFILIGMPASESGSALLIPLAGHELGHAVWRNRQLTGGAAATLQYKCEELYHSNLGEFSHHYTDYDPNDIVRKEILTDAIATSVDYAVSHAEELFCDLLAYALFGESYLYAFSYILAPGSSRRTPKYPTYKTRIEVLREKASNEGVTLPEFKALEFGEQREPGDPRLRFALKMAETSVASITKGLWETAEQLLTKGAVLRPNLELARTHLKAFRMGIPASEPRCLGDVINAGWMYYREIQGSTDVDKTLGEKADHLNEMVLKTVEILEYRRRVRSGS